MRIFALAFVLKDLAQTGIVKAHRGRVASLVDVTVSSCVCRTTSFQQQVFIFSRPIAGIKAKSGT